MDRGEGREAITLPKAASDAEPNKPARTLTKGTAGHHGIAMADAKNQRRGSNEAVATSSNTGRKRKAPTLKPADWECHKETIWWLFVDQNNGLPKVRQVMIDQNNFTASLRQYKSQIKHWGWEKNVKAEEMAKMVQIQTRRRREGKRTAFTVRGMQVSSQKIERWLKRTTLQPPETGNELEVSIPPDIKVITPATTPRDSGCVVEENESDDDSTPHYSQDLILQDADIMYNSPGPCQLEFDPSEPFPDIGIDAPEEDNNLPIFKLESFLGDGQVTTDINPPIKAESLLPPNSEASLECGVNSGPLERESQSLVPQDIGRDEDPDGPTSNKRQKREATQQDIIYSCPYRKRNPLRFNAREYGPCSRTGFATFSELKRHVMKSHIAKPKYMCQRCSETFDSQAPLNKHTELQKEQKCEQKSANLQSLDPNPEDGIPEEVSRMLIDRKHISNTWEELWKVLFPSDTSEIPLPDFEPIVEIHEVEHSVLAGLEDLKLVIREKAEMTRRSLSLDPTALDDLSGMVVAAVEEFVENQLSRCKNQRRNDLAAAKSRPRTRTNSSVSKQFQPPEIRVSSDPNQTDHILRASSPRYLPIKPSRSNSVKSTRSTHTQDSRQSNQLLIPSPSGMLDPEHLSPLSATSTTEWSTHSPDQTDVLPFPTGNFNFSSPFDLGSLSAPIDNLSNPWSNMTGPSNDIPLINDYLPLDSQPTPVVSELVSPMSMQSSSMLSSHMMDPASLTASGHHTPRPPYSDDDVLVDNTTSMQVVLFPAEDLDVDNTRVEGPTFGDPNIFMGQPQSYPKSN